VAVVMEEKGKVFTASGGGARGAMQVCFLPFGV